MDIRSWLFDRRERKTASSVGPRNSGGELRRGIWGTGRDNPHHQSFAAKSERLPPGGVIPLVALGLVALFIPQTSAPANYPVW